MASCLGSPSLPSELEEAVLLDRPTVPEAPVFNGADEELIHQLNDWRLEQSAIIMEFGAYCDMLEALLFGEEG